MSTRIFLSLSNEQLQKFESAREKLGMKRSRYLQYLINGQKEYQPAPLKYRELISTLSCIERDLKLLVMKDTLSDAERILLFTKIGEIQELLSTRESPEYMDSEIYY